MSLCPCPARWPHAPGGPEPSRPTRRSSCGPWLTLTSPSTGRRVTQGREKRRRSKSLEKSTRSVHTWGLFSVILNLFARLRWSSWVKETCSVYLSVKKFMFWSGNKQQEAQIKVQARKRNNSLGIKGKKSLWSSSSLCLGKYFWSFWKTPCSLYVLALVSTWQLSSQ